MWYNRKKKCKQKGDAEMGIVKTILPVVSMLLLGGIFRNLGFLKREGIDNIKFLVTKVMLPVAIFHALGTADYSKKTGVIVIIIFIMLVLTFSVGFLLRPLLEKRYRRYLPYLVSVYEGGMLAYPLFTNLCGAEKLSHIAILDIATSIFGFSVYMSMLSQMESGEKTTLKGIIGSAFRNPAFLASILGITFGLTGALPAVLTTGGGVVYQAMVDMLTASLSPMILLVVGFELTMKKEFFVPCLKSMGMRLAVQGLAAWGVITAVHHFVGNNPYTDIAILIYMSVPTTFSTQSYLVTEDGNEFVATTNSMYCLVTIALYMVIVGVAQIWLI